jgi:hypothetical protein
LTRVALLAATARTVPETIQGDVRHCVGLSVTGSRGRGQPVLVLGRGGYDLNQM